MSITAPVSWADAVRYVKENTVESLGKFGRCQKDTDTYMEFKNKILEEYCSMADYLQVVHFQASTTKNADGKKVVTGNVQDGDKPAIRWAFNDFGYWFVEPVQHHLIWSTQPLPKEQIEEIIKENRVGYDTIWFVNPRVQQSIPRVWHCHVLSLKGDHEAARILN